jgi:hypothetical protein
MLSLPAMLHMMQYWQSMRQSVGMELVCEAGKQKVLYKYTAKHFHIHV